MFVFLCVIVKWALVSVLLLPHMFPRNDCNALGSKKLPFYDAHEKKKRNLSVQNLSIHY
jgi:hypothetical protein